MALRFIIIVTVLLTAATGIAGREFPPAVPSPSPLVLPTPKVHRLANGLQVVVMQRHSLPLVTLRLVVRCGAAADPEGLPGVAEMVAALLSQGTTRRNAQQVSEAIDVVGGTFESAAEWDASSAALTVLADHTELAFDVLSDIAMHPTFAPQEVERRRKLTLSALEVLHDDPAYAADRVFDLLVFAGTPYGHLLDGTPGSLERITVGDLKAYHLAHYRPENSILALVGDIAEDDAVKLAERFFGAWKPGKGREAPSNCKPRDDQRRVVVVDKPDAVQTEIRVGNRAIGRASPDYDALTVANQILGGPATNRLFKTLRSQQGLTYGASSDLVSNRSTGSWVAKTSTRTSGTAKTLDAILDQLKRLRDRPISGAELRTAQGYLVGHMALEFETPEQIAERTLELMVYDLPLDTWNRFAANVEALRAEDVFAATRRHLDPGVIVLVGDAAGFSSELKKLGRVEIIPLKKLDFDSPLFARGAEAKSGD